MMYKSKFWKMMIMTGFVVQGHIWNTTTTTNNNEIKIQPLRNASLNYEM